MNNLLKSNTGDTCTQSVPKACVLPATNVGCCLPCLSQQRDPFFWGGGGGRAACLPYLCAQAGELLADVLDLAQPPRQLLDASLRVLQGRGGGQHTCFSVS